MALSPSRSESKPYRRDRFQIWSAILESCLYQNRTQSWLIRKIGLNTSAAKDALSTLTKGGLLELVEQPTRGRFEYRTTRQGENTLKEYYHLVAQFLGTKPEKTTKHHSSFW
jgi:predicted transcriptional regulator